MMELLSEPQDGFLSVRSAGLVTDEDYQSIGLELERVIAATDKPINCLLDWEMLEGWDATAAANAFTLRIKIRSRLRRVAVLADVKWRDEIELLAEIIGAAEFRMFPITGKEAAVAWLHET